MPIGKLTLEIEIPHAQSLKDRRQLVRSLKDSFVMASICLLRNSTKAWCGIGQHWASPASPAQHPTLRGSLKRLTLPLSGS